MAFQKDAFQNNAFQMLGSVPSVAVGGGIDDYKRYRRQIEKMLKAAEKRDVERYKKESKKLVDIAKKVDANIPESPKVIQDKSQEKNVVDFDFTSIISEISRLLLHVERVIAKQEQQILLKQREEEEIIFLLALS